MKNQKTYINFALVLKTSLEDVNDLKNYIETILPGTRIIFQKQAPGWVKLYIKEDNGGGQG